MGKGAVTLIVHIRLSDADLWRRVKAQAALDSQSIGELVERALKRLLQEPESLRPQKRKGTGLLHGAGERPYR